VKITTWNEFVSEDKEDKIQEILKNILVEFMGVDRGRIYPEVRIVDDLGADSLDQMELVIAVEEEFSISIPDEDAKKIQTFGQALTYLKEHVCK